MYQKKILIMVSILCIAATLSGCMLLPKEDEKLSPPIIEANATEYKTEAVMYGTVNKKVETFGSFKPINEVFHNYEYLGGTFLQFFFTKNDDVKAGDVVAVLDTGDLETRIRDMEIEIQRARLSYEKATEQYNNKLISLYDYEIEQLNYEKVQNHYNDLIEEKNQSELRAKEDGTISYLAPLEEGDTITKGDLIFKIIKNNEMILTCIGSSIYKFEMDSKVVLTSLNHVVEGTIVNKGTNTMTIQPDEHFDDWKIGTSVMVSQNLDTAEDVLMVNQKAIKFFGGKSYAKILENGVPVEKEVVLGLTNGKYYEVVSGLSEGDEAIIY
ncbi:MAG: hypothetical protein JXQ23_07880 [Clostridia bacterium]|nr:hypothetical protein [Clostridia bacterium]